MDTYQKLNAKIAKIMQEIEEDHPELMKYVEELPITIPSEPEQKQDLKMLKEYYDSLKAILARYKENE